MADKPIKAIKGFDHDLQCRGFQFAVGETYKHEGTVEACVGGFHAIPEDVHPLAVFSFYPPAGSRFCVVEVNGKTDRESDKIAAEILTVQREIGLGELAQEAVDWVMARASLEGPVAVKDNGLATASGDQGAATASGYQGAATASGYRGAATASGYQGAATASGYQGAATASGYRGAATASGDQGAATASGYLGQVQGKEGNALFAVERETWDGPILSVACGIVGKDGIKADTWYHAKGGKLVEVAQ
ncbi:hypothetical protein PARHAE_00723 [Paracoccus haematequi]|uniref:DUF7666 domain-containing protein n=1 Tax=Paracoccus haematequi TaxID=2491866 RepID=A0A3S4CI07_9RHOB|nr:hypothetical protein [Paracoccus haematequi]VDS07546.1 hypothetical protein PARHAE_00723 [Paracoccus haematequi]